LSSAWLYSKDSSQIPDFDEVENAQIAFGKCRSSTRRDMESEDCPYRDLEKSSCGTTKGQQAQCCWGRPSRPSRSCIFDRRKLILRTEMWMLGMAIVLAATTITRTMTPWLLLLLTFGLSAGDAIEAPTWRAIFPELVSKEDRRAKKSSCQSRCRPSRYDPTTNSPSPANGRRMEEATSRPCNLLSD
jgi:hypothetical protein